MGQFSLTSTPIDHTSADLWVGHPMNLSVDLGRPIPERWLSRVAVQPEVVQVETYIIGMIVVDRADGRSELCTVVGSSLQDDAARRRRPADAGAAAAAERARLRRRGRDGAGPARLLPASGTSPR